MKSNDVAKTISNNNLNREEIYSIYLSNDIEYSKKDFGDLDVIFFDTEKRLFTLKKILKVRK